MLGRGRWLEVCWGGGGGCRSVGEGEVAGGLLGRGRWLEVC